MCVIYIYIYIDTKMDVKYINIFLVYKMYTRGIVIAKIQESLISMRSSLPEPENQF